MCWKGTGDKVTTDAAGFKRTHLSLIPHTWAVSAYTSGSLQEAQWEMVEVEGPAYLFQLRLRVDGHLAQFTVKRLAGHTHDRSRLVGDSLFNSAGGPGRWRHLSSALWQAALLTILHLSVLQTWCRQSQERAICHWSHGIYMYVTLGISCLYWTCCQCYNTVCKFTSGWVWIQLQNHARNYSRNASLMGSSTTQLFISHFAREKRTLCTSKQTFRSGESKYWSRIQPLSKKLPINLIVTTLWLIDFPPCSILVHYWELEQKTKSITSVEYKKYKVMH